MGRVNSPHYPIPTYNRYEPLQNAQFQSPNPHRGPPAYSRPWRGRGRGRGRGKNHNYNYPKDPQWEGEGTFQTPPQYPQLTPQWEHMNRGAPHDINGGAEEQNHVKRKRENYEYKEFLI